MARRWEGSGKARRGLGWQWQSAKGPSRPKPHICGDPRRRPAYATAKQGAADSNEYLAVGVGQDLCSPSIVYCDLIGDGHIFPLVVFSFRLQGNKRRKRNHFHDARLTPYQKRTLLVSASSVFTQMQVKYLRQI